MAWVFAIINLLIKIRLLASNETIKQCVHSYKRIEIKYENG